MRKEGRQEEVSPVFVVAVVDDWGLSCGVKYVGLGGGIFLPVTCCILLSGWFESTGG